MKTPCPLKNYTIITAVCAFALSFFVVQHIRAQAPSAPLPILQQVLGTIMSDDLSTLEVKDASDNVALSVNNTTGLVSAAAGVRVQGGNLTWGNSSMLTTEQGGSVELGASSGQVGTGTPYIDFHLQGQPAQDYNARLINQQNGSLTNVGNFIVQPSTIVQGMGNFIHVANLGWKEAYKIIRIDNTTTPPTNPQAGAIGTNEAGDAVVVYVGENPIQEKLSVNTQGINVTGDANISGNTVIGGDLEVGLLNADEISVTGSTNITGDLNVTGELTANLNIEPDDINLGTYTHTSFTSPDVAGMETPPQSYEYRKCKAITVSGLGQRNLQQFGYGIIDVGDVCADGNGCDVRVNVEHLPVIGEYSENEGTVKSLVAALSIGPERNRTINDQASATVRYAWLRYGNTERAWWLGDSIGDGNTGHGDGIQSLWDWTYISDRPRIGTNFAQNLFGPLPTTTSFTILSQWFTKATWTFCD